MTALGLLLWFGVAPAQAATYTVTVCLDDSDGNAVAPGTTSYRLNGGSANYFATTLDGASCKTQTFTVTGAASLEVWTTFNNTTSAHVTQDISSDPTFEFQTHELTLQLETCEEGVPLTGGTARYGPGATYGSWHFPGGATGVSGQTAAELFPGTFSFEMNYKGTASQKLSVVVPDADSKLTWQTTNVTIDYPGGVSYGGGTGDSTWFKQTSAPASVELMPGTYKFHFRDVGAVPGFTADLTFSGCSYYYPPVTNHVPAVATEAVNASGNEGSTLTTSGGFTDPDGDPLAITKSSGLGTVTPNVDGTWSWSLPTTDNGSGIVTVIADDGEGGSETDTFTWTADNVSPVIGAATPVNGSLFAMTTPVSLSAAFTDAGTADTHGCTVDWNDGEAPADGSVTEVAGSGNGSCAATKTFAAAGVYTVAVTVTDDDGEFGTATVMVVVYDPTAGFVTGGGWINSPLEAYVADPTLTGKATFGFVAKYKKGATVPDGNTEFQFKAGDLNFHSSSYQWLVVNQNGTNAQFKGSGTINGVGGYSFMIWATDDAPDTFRIKIWEVSDETAVVYDNDPDGSGQATGGGNIVVHT